MSSASADNQDKNQSAQTTEPDFAPDQDVPRKEGAGHGNVFAVSNSAVSWRKAWQASTWSLRAWLVLSLVFPAILVAGLVWRHQVAAFADFENAARRSLLVLQEHAGKAFATHELILRQASSLANRNLNEQGPDNLQMIRALRELVRGMDEVGSLAFADANGKLQFHSLQADRTEGSVKDRDFFLVHKGNPASGPYISQPYVGTTSGISQVAVSIARRTASGAFDGIVYTTLPLSYFTNFWTQFAPSRGYLIPLVRTDGVVLVRYPATKQAERLPADGPFMSRIRTSQQGVYTAVSMIDGIERINVYSQVKEYPLYISYSTETAAVRNGWLTEGGLWIFMGLVLTTVLVALWLANARHAYRQQESAKQWHRIANELKDEVERREFAEEALRQSKKMEAIGQLAGGIAHDFNNLLAAIVGNLELIRVRLSQQRLEDALRNTDAAVTVVDKASAMTQRLLAFSRRQTLAPEPTDLNARIAFLHELIGRAVGPSIQIDIRQSQDDCVALCDPNQFETALLNLAINARDAMPPGGKLTIATYAKAMPAHIQRFRLPQQDYVAIEVTDTGCGMAEDVLGKAFDPFFTTKPIGQGTGLGLSIVYGFVAQSDGEIRLQSTVGVGTSVFIFLPRIAGVLPETAPSTKQFKATKSVTRATILLVDDEEPLRVLLAETLAELGHDVLPAADAAQAIELLQSSQTIHLMVSDIGLPGNLNGAHLAETTKTLRPNLPVLLITGFADRVESGKALVGSGAEVMLKPFRLDDFARKVTSLLGSNHARDGLKSCGQADV